MPVHDWTRVAAGIFHDFHNAWVLELANVFNGGLLPSGYYALTEQHAGKYVADLLTLHASRPDEALPPLPAVPAVGAGTEAVAEPAPDPVEQERRAFRQSGRDLGNAPDLEAWIGSGDVAQRSELLNRGNEIAQIPVHRASLSCRKPWTCRLQGD